MNFANERNKPIFVTRSYQITTLNASNVVNEALANDTIVRAKHAGGDYFVKASAARRLANQSDNLLLRVDESTSGELNELITTRLEMDRDAKFEFLDGRVFSGADAAREIRNKTEVGKYFYEVEKETLRILQEAFQKGEF